MPALAQHPADREKRGSLGIRGTVHGHNSSSLNTRTSRRTRRAAARRPTRSLRLPPPRACAPGTAPASPAFPTSRGRCGASYPWRVEPHRDGRRGDLPEAIRRTSWPLAAIRRVAARPLGSVLITRRHLQSHVPRRLTPGGVGRSQQIRSDLADISRSRSGPASIAQHPGADPRLSEVRYAGRDPR
jgi:hypothetical protein